MSDPPRDDSAAHLATWIESWGATPPPVRDCVTALRARLEMESEARQLAEARADKADDIARRWRALPPGPRDNVLAVLEMYERIEGER